MAFVSLYIQKAFAQCLNTCTYTPNRIFSEYKTRSWCHNLSLYRNMLVQWFVYLLVGLVGRLVGWFVSLVGWMVVWFLRAAVIVFQITRWQQVPVYVWVFFFRIPRGARDFCPLQNIECRYGTHSVSCPVGNGVLSAACWKRPEREVVHSSPYTAVIKNEWSCTYNLPACSHRVEKGKFSFTLLKWVCVRSRACVCVQWYVRHDLGTFSLLCL
jgi:hypothetical protein